MAVSASRERAFPVEAEKSVRFEDEVVRAGDGEAKGGERTSGSKVEVADSISG
jgi:hypothetical protein